METYGSRSRAHSAIVLRLAQSSLGNYFAASMGSPSSWAVWLRRPRESRWGSCASAVASIL
eukprot:11154927-Lingulodinium_polyedra.AAC.1